MASGGYLGWAPCLQQGYQEQVNSILRRGPFYLHEKRELSALVPEKVAAHQSLPRWPLGRTKGNCFFKSRICKLGITSKWDLSSWMLFFFVFFQMDKLGSVFYVFQTPGIPVGPYSLAFPFPARPPFFFHFSQLATALLCPPLLPPSYLLVCNLFAVRLSLWFTGPLLSRIIINGLLCCIPASSPPCVAWVKPLANRMPAACTKARARPRLSALYIFP